MSGHESHGAAAGGGHARPRANLTFLDFNRLPEPLEPIADLKARVDLLEIARRHVELKRKGRDWWGCCPFHAESTPSFKVNPERQAFRCFGCGAKGDALDFLALAEGLDLTGAIECLRELAGDAGADPAAVARRMARRAAAAAQEARDDARRRQKARRIWCEAVPLCPRGEGEGQRYLRERRGIPWWAPETVRWHPRCPWGLGVAGCIVAPVHDPAGEVMGVWRIRPAMEGKVDRWGLGPTAGGCSRLFEAEGPALAVAEGVEDALAARELTGWPAWAALSAGNMAALELPAIHTEVLILADADATGRAKAHQLAHRLRAEGRAARVLKPIAGKDPNDVLLARRAA